MPDSRAVRLTPPPAMAPRGVPLRSPAARPFHRGTLPEVSPRRPAPCRDIVGEHRWFAYGRKSRTPAIGFEPICRPLFPQRQWASNDRAATLECTRLKSVSAGSESRNSIAERCLSSDAHLAISRASGAIAPIDLFDGGAGTPGSPHAVAEMFGHQVDMMQVIVRASVNLASSLRPCKVRARQGRPGEKTPLVFYL